ncbi:MAG: hypothetical protein K6C36_05670 [Clostridia bacterium]|nr:hypothetical protein [Clostridia bacterium]
MANCPNCGRKLRLTDYKPVCPDCGVNINYWNINERLLVESEQAEVDHAKFQPKVDRAKAAYIGSWQSILRIVLTLLPVGALFLPLFETDGWPKTVMEVFGFVQNNAGALLKEPAAAAAVLCAALGAVFSIVCLILIASSLGPHGKRRTAVFYGLGAVFCVAALAAELVWASSETALAAAPVTVAVGSWLFAVLGVVRFAWCEYLLVKGVKIRHTPCIIGGLPAEEYFGLVEKGESIDDIRRKMLIALTRQEVERVEQAKRDAGIEEEGGAA